MEADDDLFSAIKARKRPAPRLPDGDYTLPSNPTAVEVPDTRQLELQSPLGSQASILTSSQTPAIASCTDDLKQLSTRPRPRRMADSSTSPNILSGSPSEGSFRLEGRWEPEQEDGLRSDVIAYSVKRTRVKELSRQFYDTIQSLESVNLKREEKSQKLAGSEAFEDWKVAQAPGFCACSTRWKTFQDEMESCFQQIEEMIELHREYFSAHAEDGLPLSKPTMEKRVVEHSMATFHKLKYLRSRYHELAIPMASKTTSDRRYDKDDFTGVFPGCQFTPIPRNDSAKDQNRRKAIDSEGKMEQTAYSVSLKSDTGMSPGNHLPYLVLTRA
uniref:AlNc14C30G2797 protein n=1 Tax=Albugo laibachii Nc14 TaxID=890382 RepID=F0W7J1_9STRA|nr:AlNc14C30G2797 [Albugo laibachii Nc14]|eukprot:CCA17092.1 AlNc14C30G2797 [Albugo laibachii Nc14]